MSMAKSTSTKGLLCKLFWHIKNSEMYILNYKYKSPFLAMIYYDTRYEYKIKVASSSWLSCQTIMSENFRKWLSSLVHSSAWLSYLADNLFFSPGTRSLWTFFRPKLFLKSFLTRSSFSLWPSELKIAKRPR